MNDIFFSKVLTLHNLIIDFEFSKFRLKKHQMVITLEREIRLECFRNECCPK